jgi:hypothetical protein
MKKIIVAVIIMILIPNYVHAEDRKTTDPVNYKTLKGYLPLPAKYNYYFFKEGITKETETSDFLDCIEGQRRIISFGRMDDGDEKTKSYRGYHSTVWITIQCMENKGYVGRKHKLIEVPYFDDH